MSSALPSDSFIPLGGTRKENDSSFLLCELSFIDIFPRYTCVCSKGANAFARVFLIQDSTALADEKLSIVFVRWKQ
jgi:hypothetical protein